jgi:hypothetical protein
MMRERLEVIDAFYQPDALDCWTIVFNEQSPINPYYFTMLALSRYAQSFSQWTEGAYEPGAANEHLGQRVRFDELDASLQNHVREMMSDGE